MSDGNFNRALLPSTPYASGVKMGKQQMKAKALSALAEAIEENLPHIRKDEKEALLLSFSKKLV